MCLTGCFVKITLLPCIIIPESGGTESLSIHLFLHQWCSQTTAANIGRLRESKDNVNNTANQMDIRQPVNYCCCGFFFFLFFFQRRCQMNRWSFSVVQDKCLCMLLKECGQTTSKCGLSDRFSNVLSMCLGSFNTCTCPLVIRSLRSLNRALVVMV